MSVMGIFHQPTVGDRISTMPGWGARWQKRRRELAQGADADLMQFNRRRFRVAFGLIGIALVLGLLSAAVRMQLMVENALRIAAGISAVVGVVLAKWAHAEHSFLTEPEQEGPPEIFKKGSD
jgi:hypothetical protein